MHGCPQLHHHDPAYIKCHFCCSCILLGVTLHSELQCHSMPTATAYGQLPGSFHTKRHSAVIAALRCVALATVCLRCTILGTSGQHMHGDDTHDALAASDLPTLALDTPGAGA